MGIGEGAEVREGDRGSRGGKKSQQIRRERQGVNQRGDGIEEKEEEGKILGREQK